MCYNIQYYARKIKREAARLGINTDAIEPAPEVHYASGFSHPDLICQTDSKPNQLTLLSWGLIPSWIKTSTDAVKLSNQTLNAVGETIFEKPSFRSAAKSRRCIVWITGFYEYHHLDAKTKIPYFIQRKDENPMRLAGLWETWTDREHNITRQTVSIVTTKANSIMSKIHNNPTAIQRNGARMPVILPDELAIDWIKHDEDPNIDKAKANNLLLPFPEDLLTWHTVAPLQGKAGTGNRLEASKFHEYEQHPSMQA